MANPVRFDARDIRDLERAARKIDGIAKKQITPAVRRAMKPVLQAAKAKAPKDTRALSKALKLMGERSQTPGKRFTRWDRTRPKTTFLPMKTYEKKRNWRNVAA